MYNKEFLTADWSNLIHISYKVEAQKLLQFLPDNLHLEEVDGNAVVTIVAFDFSNTAIKGINIPIYGNFPEVNLRINVRDWENKYSGVVFIKEITPRAFINWAANWLYNEHYSIKDINYLSEETSQEYIFSYFINIDGHEYQIKTQTQKFSVLPPEKSIDYLLKQRNAGFGKDKDGNTIIYEVEHSNWSVYPTVNYFINMDYGKIFGNYWNFLNNQKPFHVMVAKGSNVKISEWRYY